MTIDNAIDAPLVPLDIPAEIIGWATTNASAIDSGATEAAALLPQLADEGLLDLGAPLNHEGGLAQQAATIEMIARGSFSTAFAIWGHRMVIEFLELSGGVFAESALPTLRSGTTPGASAMAPGYKALVGAGDLGLRIVRDNTGKLRLFGRIAWASNLYSNGVAVAPAYGPDAPASAKAAQDGVVVAFPLNAPGAEIGPELNLLAMQGTASTSVSLDNVEVSQDQILTAGNFTEFLQRSRPTLSILQASFCLGLATTSYQEALRKTVGVNAVFADELDQLGQRLSTTKRQLADLASRVGTADPPRPQEVLTMRLAAGQVAVELVALETKTAGGKGFIATSDTNRRYREATFIPLQAPSEAQLRWELTQTE